MTEGQREFSNQTIEVPFWVYAFKVDGKRRLAWSDAQVTSAYVPFVRKDAYDKLITDFRALWREHQRTKFLSDGSHFEVDIKINNFIANLEHKS